MEKENEKDAVKDEKTRDSFTFFRSFRDALKGLPKDVKAEVLDMIMDYGLDGTEPVSAKPLSLSMFTLIKPNMDNSKKRRDNGKKGGAPAGNGNARKQPKNNQDGENGQPKNNQDGENGQPKNNQDGEKNNKKTSDMDKDKDMDKDSECSLPPTPETVGAERIGYDVFGVFRNVHLKPAERRSLVEQFGEDAVKSAIDDLSCKMMDGSTQSINHHATLVYWLSCRKSGAGAAQRFAKPSATTDPNRDSIEERIRRTRELWDAASEEDRKNYLDTYHCYPWEREMAENQ